MGSEQFTLDARLAKKCARGLTGLGNNANAADIEDIFKMSIDRGMVPVYICNTGASGNSDGSAIFGVHTHGWWRGGNVTYNPITNTTLSQTLINKASGKGGTAIIAGTGAALYTVTAGKKLYIKSLAIHQASGTVGTFELRDGSISGTIIASGGLAPNASGSFELSFDAPLEFSTSVFIDTGANQTVYWTLSGFEE